MKTDKKIFKSASIFAGALLTSSLAAVPASGMDILAYNDLGSGSQVRTQLVEMNANQGSSSSAAAYKMGEAKCGEEAKKDDKSAETKKGDAVKGEAAKEATAGEAKKVEAKCGEGKCGEGKCGEGDKKDVKKAESESKAKEAKCGEGKCG